MLMSTITRNMEEHNKLGEVFSKRENSSSAIVTLRSDVFYFCADQSQQLKQSIENLSDPDDEWYLRTAIWVFLGFMILLFILISVYCIQILKEETGDFEDDWEEEDAFFGRHRERCSNSSETPTFVHRTDDLDSNLSNVGLNQVSVVSGNDIHAAYLRANIFHFEYEKSASK